MHDRAGQLGGRRGDARELQRASTGYGMNPYDPRRDPREAHFDGRPALATGGSSSGVGTAASFWAANVGTETSGSILSPANQNMLVGNQAHARPRSAATESSPSPPTRTPPGPWPGPWPTRRSCSALWKSAAPDPNDPATETLHAAPRPRLHALPEPEGTEGRAHRHPARVLLRQGDAARGRRSRAAG